MSSVPREMKVRTTSSRASRPSGRLWRWGKAWARPGGAGAGTCTRWPEGNLGATAEDSQPVPGRAKRRLNRRPSPPLPGVDPKAGAQAGVCASVSTAAAAATQ